MSNTPLPEPDDDLQGKEIAPGIYERGYRKDQLHAHAAAVSAAKDAEIAQLRADLIKSLVDDKALRERVRVLEDALRGMVIANQVDKIFKTYIDGGKDAGDERHSFLRVGDALTAARAALEQKP